jgi:hypothetical protein
MSKSCDALVASRSVASRASDRGSPPQFPRPSVAHHLADPRRTSVVGSHRIVIRIVIRIVYLRIVYRIGIPDGLRRRAGFVTNTRGSTEQESATLELSNGCVVVSLGSWIALALGICGLRSPAPVGSGQRVQACREDPSRRSTRSSAFGPLDESRHRCRRWLCACLTVGSSRRVRIALRSDRPLRPTSRRAGCG